MPLDAGTTLGPYAIVSAIGAGGMGEVYSLGKFFTSPLQALKANS